MIALCVFIISPFRRHRRRESAPRPSRGGTDDFDTIGDPADSVEFLDCRLCQLLLMIRGNPPPEDDDAARNFNFQIPQCRESCFPKGQRGFLEKLLIGVH